MYDVVTEGSKSQSCTFEILRAGFLRVDPEE